MVEYMLCQRREENRREQKRKEKKRKEKKRKERREEETKEKKEEGKETIVSGYIRVGFEALATIACLLRTWNRIVSGGSFQITIMSLAYAEWSSSSTLTIKTNIPRLSPPSPLPHPSLTPPSPLPHPSHSSLTPLTTPTV